MRCSTAGVSIAATAASWSFRTIGSGVPFGGKGQTSWKRRNRRAPVHAPRRARAGLARIACQNRDRLDHAARELWNCDRRVRALIVDAPGNQVLHRRGGPPIRDMRDRDPDLGIEQRAGEVARGAQSTGAELHFRGVRLRVGDELQQIVGGQAPSGEQNERRLRHQHHRREIPGGVVKGIFVERLGGGMAADIAKHELIAVGRRVGDTGRAGHAAGAADVFNNSLTQQLGEARCQNASDNVDVTADRIGHDHRHRARRPALRQGGDA
jgi:hypothetical protein